ncbi:MAG: DUF177 domain-containing protein, partial [Gemmatimonadota bacterium]|nr:DUF177 domain-containing protein [Gemmatimonadota bacterium]
MDELRVPLSALRAGPVTRTVRTQDPQGAFGELPFPLEEVEVEIRVERGAGDEVRARGQVWARARLPCRRCLKEVPLQLEAILDAWFRPEGEVEAGEEGVWVLGDAEGEVDLGPPVREELWMAAPEYVECTPGCEGLCPGCGVRLDEESCTCGPPELDPRWEALRSLADAGSEKG